MADLFEEIVKGLVILAHRAPTMEDVKINRKVDALVDVYLARFGTEKIASELEKLARAFREKAPTTIASDRIRARIFR